MSSNIPEVQSVMHPIKLRKLKVLKTEMLSPFFKKVTFHSEDLSDFISASPDDHVKAFFPDPETKQYVVPQLGENGLAWDESGPAPIMRDYTPLNYSAKDKTLELIFFLRKQGAAAVWANDAKEGSELYIAGPRGSYVVNYVFDWYLFITDEAGLPSLSRRLSEMPKEAKGLVLVEISSLENSFKLDPNKIPSGIEIKWLERKETRAAGKQEAFLEELQNFKRPSGNGFAWIKTEGFVGLQLKKHLIKNNITKEDWIKMSGYWKKTPDRK